MAIWTYSGNVYNSSPAGTTTFPLISREGNSIAYLQRSHIHVYSSPDAGVTWFEIVASTGYSFNNEGTEIVLTAGIPADTQIKLQRITPYLDEYVTFQASSQLTAGQLNTGELFSIYVDQELSDQLALLNSVAFKYLGGTDLTVDAAPVYPENGDFYLNTGAGTVLASWIGIGGDSCVGSEQVIYSSSDAKWEIFLVPSSQVGVVGIVGAGPITVDESTASVPIIGIDEATTSAKGALSAADKTKLDALVVEQISGKSPITVDNSDPANPIVGADDYVYPGGVQQTLQERLEQYVSVLDYGADPTGVADSASAIQACIDANQNQTVFFPKGTYKISSQGTVELGAYASGETPENIAYCLKTTDKRTKLKGDNAVLKSDWNGTPSLTSPIGIVSDAGNEEHVFEGLTFQNLQFGIANVKKYVDTQAYAVLCQYKDLVFENVGIGIYALAFERCTFDFIKGKNTTLCLIAQGGIWNSTLNTQGDNSGFFDKCTLNFISNLGSSAGSVTSNSAAFDIWFDDHFFKTANNSLLSPSGTGPATAYPYQGISGRTIYAMARYSRPQANNVLNLISHMNLHRGALCFETGVTNTASGVYTENVGYADAQGRSQPIGGSATDPYLGAGVRLPYIIQGSTVESAEFQFTYAARVFGNNVRNFERPTVTGCDITLSQTQTYREGTFLASGGINYGIPSGDATTKTLRDYEQGTWSPVWSFSGGGTLTPDVVQADYIKIGSQVTVIASIRTQGTVPSTGDARLTGLPFAPSSYGSGSLSSVSSWATDLANLKAFAHPSSYIRFLTNPSTGTTNSELQRSDFADGTNKNSIYLTLTYFTTQSLNKLNNYDQAATISYQASEKIDRSVA